MRSAGPQAVAAPGGGPYRPGHDRGPRGQQSASRFIGGRFCRRRLSRAGRAHLNPANQQPGGHGPSATSSSADLAAVMLASAFKGGSASGGQGPSSSRASISVRCHRHPPAAHLNPRQGEGGMLLKRAARLFPSLADQQLAGSGWPAGPGPEPGGEVRHQEGQALALTDQLPAALGHLGQQQPAPSGRPAGASYLIEPGPGPSLGRARCCAGFHLIEAGQIAQPPRGCASLRPAGGGTLDRGRISAIGPGKAAAPGGDRCGDAPSVDLAAGMAPTSSARALSPMARGAGPKESTLRAATVLGACGGLQPAATEWANWPG